MKTWILKEYSDEKDLSACLLKNRGVLGVDWGSFLNPRFDSDYSDPFKILNMEQAVSRIIGAVKKNEKIIVFGDYDADGISGAVIIHDFFKKINFQNFDVHIPDRYEEGYGLSSQAVDEFVKQEINLIIMVDCGITNFKEVEKAMSSKIDVVIIDHHIPPFDVPPAHAVVDVFQKNDTYPFKELSGAGMAFKTVSAILKKKEFPVSEEWQRQVLDVLAIATIADMVSLKEENRALVSAGLDVLKKTQRLGLKILFRKLKINQSHLTADDVAFMVAPRLNAASRMDHASTSFLLLVTNSAPEAEWLCDLLEERNNERKNSVLKIIRKIKNSGRLDDDLIFIGSKDWPPGILGLAAGRVLDELQKPIFIWGKDSKGLIKISARSASVDLVKLMRSAPENLFIDIGGHEFAAGATIEERNLGTFEEVLKDNFKKIPVSEFKDPILMIDRKMDLEEVNPETQKVIGKLEPFGMGNPKPVFLFESLRVENVKLFGNGGLHLELAFKKPNGESIRAIGFFMAENFGGGVLKTGNVIDLAASFDMNHYNGNPELRLRIVDVKLK